MYFASCEIILTWPSILLLSKCYYELSLAKLCSKMMELLTSETGLIDSPFIIGYNFLVKCYFLNGIRMILDFYVITTTKKLADLLLLKQIRKVEIIPEEKESNKRKLVTCALR